MADISNKVDELTGRAKQAAGDLTGDRELQAEGSADTARAKVEQGVDAAAEKAEDVKQAVAETVDDAGEKLTALGNKAAGAVEEVHLDDRRVLYVAAAAAAALLIGLAVRRARTKAPSGKRDIAKGAAAGLSGVLNR